MTIIAIEQGRPRVAQMTADYQDIQNIVGGFFTTFFTVRSPDGKGRLLTGYVHDEGMYERLPTDIGVVYGDKRAIPLFGNAVIGAIDAGGESQPLSETEVSAIFRELYRNEDGEEIFFPILEQMEDTPDHRIPFIAVKTVFRVDKLAAQGDN